MTIYSYIVVGIDCIKWNTTDYIPIVVGVDCIKWNTTDYIPIVVGVDCIKWNTTDYIPIVVGVDCTKWNTTDYIASFPDVETHIDCANTCRNSGRNFLIEHISKKKFRTLLKYNVFLSVCVL